MMDNVVLLFVVSIFGLVFVSYMSEYFDRYLPQYKRTIAFMMVSNVVFCLGVAVSMLVFAGWVVSGLIYFLIT